MIGRDIRSTRWLYLKAILFLVIGGMAAGLVWLRSPTLLTAGLLLLSAWAFARAYYFAFYVIEHYADPQFRYAGILDLLSYLLRNGAWQEKATTGQQPADSRERSRIEGSQHTADDNAD